MYNSFKDIVDGFVAIFTRQPKYQDYEPNYVKWYNMGRQAYYDGDPTESSKYHRCVKEFPDTYKDLKYAMEAWDDGYYGR